MVFTSVFLGENFSSHFKIIDILAYCFSQEIGWIYFYFVLQVMELRIQCEVTGPSFCKCKYRTPDQVPIINKIKLILSI